jgi:protein ImuB
MRLVLALEDRTRHERSFTIPCPTSEPEVLFRILSTHLDGLQLAQRPVGVRLTIHALTPENQQLRLFESPLRDPNRLGETLGRLAALVGSDNVGVAVCEDTHQPDRFRLSSPHFDRLAAEPAEGAAPSLTMGLPLRRFRPPLTAQVQIKGEQPVYIVSDKAHGAITSALGPYRLSGHWWDAERWATEEWDIELADHGLFRVAKQGAAWFLEGCYDAALR